jgi:hypothetical protein
VINTQLKYFLSHSAVDQSHTALLHFFSEINKWPFFKEDEVSCRKKAVLLFTKRRAAKRSCPGCHLNMVIFISTYLHILRTGRDKGIHRERCRVSFMVEM